MRYRYFFLLVYFVSFSAFSADFTKLLTHLKTMQADFIQTTYDNRGKAIQKSTGKMSLSRPGKFRWEILKPIPQLIMISGTKVWIYDADLAQVTIRSLKTLTNETPGLLLSRQNTSFAKDFSIKEIKPLAKSSKEEVWFTLVPKNSDNMFASIKIGFLKEAISGMHLEDHLGHTTSIEFIHTKTNSRLPANLFVFHSPRGSDLIDETNKK